ncbi:DNA polymerase subunit Cdc27-domain-containing protein [Choanephora cucurbitarum]|nr:DNA polymerase subunit Cdc27-domain-containing protein [Choanephora cucurbitarum]
MADYQEFLTVTVIQEKKPVTYKSLARSLGIHVNTAKQALYEFSKSTPDVNTVYCLTGIDYVNNHYTIQLVKESELEDKKKTFRTLTGVHVYSVSSFDLKDMTLLLAAYKDMPKLSLGDRVRYGMLKHTQVSQDKKAKPGPSMPALPKVKTEITPKSAPSVEPKSNKRKDPFLSNPSAQKKQAVAKPAEKKPKAIKKSQQQQKDDDDIERRMAKTTLKASDIFSDDEDFVSEPHKQEEPTKETPEPEEDVDMDEPEEKPEKKEVVPTLPPGKVRRQVLKKKTTRNARGHLVTEEVLEWEIVDAPKTTEKPAPTSSNPVEAKLNTKKPAAKSNKKPAQSKLSSFFKKA